MAEPGKPVPSRTEGGQAKNDSMRIDARQVQELADLLTRNGLSEIEVEDGDRKIKVSRDLAPVAAPASAAAPAPVSKSQPVPAPAEDVVGQAVKSPMVGTAFLSAEPGAKPFIAVGNAVKAGDTLLIIEAMKVMNPIISPQGGVIRKILVANAQPVEFDQPLVILG